MKKIIMGESHAALMAKQLGQLSDTWENIRDGVIPLVNQSDKLRGYFVSAHDSASLFLFYSQEGQHYIKINESVLPALKDLDQDDSVCFLLLGGNEHNGLFMQTHSQAFDFWDPSLPEHIIVGRQIIPREVIGQLLAQSLQRIRPRLALISGALPNSKKYVVAPPPPIPSESHLRQHSESFDFKMRPLEDKWLRLKVYRVYIGELDKLCSLLGLTLIRAPMRTMDLDGFLLPGLWYHATHAQPEYYQGIFEAFDSPHGFTGSC
jgi:hypothetical protein